MNLRPAFLKRGSYGMDGPVVFGFLGFLILISFVMSLYAAIRYGIVVPLIPVAIMLVVAAFVMHTTLRGKFLVWAELLDQLQLRGDERILDLGCGRGAVLLMAAHRLSTGRAVGVDLWRSVDQSWNSMAATQRNALAEGVSDRIELHTSDIQSLPFEDESFDLVTSSLVIHNIHQRGGREQAIMEAVRVLRPGGRLVITDIQAKHHPSLLKKLGMNDVAIRSLDWRFWWGGPFFPTQLVAATKPIARSIGPI